MPNVTSSFRSPWWLKNPHAATIIPSIYRKVEGIRYERERLELSDGDFVDLDWLRTGSNKVVIISHGLEGHTSRSYVMGTAKYFCENGWDVLAWNCRGCSGEMNRTPRMYHHADYFDISEVIQHAGEYEDKYLVGYSMGGSMSLNYLAQFPNASSLVRGAAVFSVPLDLYSSVRSLSQSGNQFYRSRFLKKLRNRMLMKHAVFPAEFNIEGIENIRTFEEFDTRFTAPIHGFSDAMDFYAQGSTLSKLKDIEVPVLIVNAINDPFLGDECYPIEYASSLTNIFLETPKEGGHVGFSMDRKYTSYMDYRPAEFFLSMD